jgi:hypothetical protein
MMNDDGSTSLWDDLNLAVMNLNRNSLCHCPWACSRHRECVLCHFGFVDGTLLRTRELDVHRILIPTWTYPLKAYSIYGKARRRPDAMHLYFNIKLQESMVYHSGCQAINCPWSWSWQKWLTLSILVMWHNLCRHNILFLHVLACHHFSVGEKIPSKSIIFDKVGILAGL